MSAQRCRSDCTLSEGKRDKIIRVILLITIDRSNNVGRCAVETVLPCARKPEISTHDRHGVAGCCGDSLVANPGSDTHRIMAQYWPL